MTQRGLPLPAWTNPWQAECFLRTCRARRRTNSSDPHRAASDLTYCERIICKDQVQGDGRLTITTPGELRVLVYPCDM